MIASVPVAAQRQAPPSRDPAELGPFMDELWQRLRVFANRSAAIPADQYGSFEWLAAAGAFWWEARERSGLTRDEVAQQLDVPPGQIRFFEFGLVPLQQMSERRLRSYAQILGEPELYEQFRLRFEL
jgi:hypothetical protein